MSSWLDAKKLVNASPIEGLFVTAERGEAFKKAAETLGEEVIGDNVVVVEQVEPEQACLLTLNISDLGVADALMAEVSRIQAAS